MPLTGVSVVVGVFTATLAAAKSAERKKKQNSGTAAFEVPAAQAFEGC